MLSVSLPRRIGASIAPVLLVALLLFPAPVVAHAELVETTPADSTIVEGTPPEIAAEFTEALEDTSSLSLRDADGTEIAVGARDDADRTRLVITDLPVLEPGDYEVRWTASSDDGHLERDTWRFTVVAPPTPTPTVAPSATTAPTAAPTPTPAPATAAPSPSPAPEDDAASTIDVLLPIIAALAIVAIAAGFLVSRRSRA